MIFETNEILFSIHNSPIFFEKINLMNKFELARVLFRPTCFQITISFHFSFKKMSERKALKKESYNNIFESIEPNWMKLNDLVHWVFSNCVEIVFVGKIWKAISQTKVYSIEIFCVSKKYFIYFISHIYCVTKQTFPIFLPQKKNRNWKYHFSS
jgi:hypothetical protein